MSKLNIDQKSVKALFSEKKADFLIPDYQRPYAWGEKECQTLWDDLFLFAFPDNDCDKSGTMFFHFRKVCIRLLLIHPKSFPTIIVPL